MIFLLGEHSIKWSYFRWAAYVAGTILVLMTELGVQFEDSISMLVRNLSHVLLMRSFNKDLLIILVPTSYLLTFLHLSRDFHLFIVIEFSFTVIFLWHFLYTSFLHLLSLLFYKP